MDRESLIRKALARIAEASLETAVARVKELKRQHSATGRLNSGSTVLSIVSICAEEFQAGCIAVLEKIQLEDREGALELAETARTDVIKKVRGHFVDLGLEEVFGARPTSGIDTRFSDRARLQGQLQRRLGEIEANVVEEFQLAVTRQSPRTRSNVHNSAFVDSDRLEALKAKTSLEWDFQRLIALCEELNTAWIYGAHHAVAMLARAILDHVPPILGCKSFSEVASSYNGAGKSFRDAMMHLDVGLRKIADGHLHRQIRRKEALPSATQVDFRGPLDQLLEEIIRITP